MKAGYEDKANRLASELPHTRESREVIQPLIQRGLSEIEINENIKNICLEMERDLVSKYTFQFRHEFANEKN